MKVRGTTRYPMLTWKMAVNKVYDYMCVGCLLAMWAHWLLMSIGVRARRAVGERGATAPEMGKAIIFGHILNFSGKPSSQKMNNFVVFIKQKNGIHSVQ